MKIFSYIFLLDIFIVFDFTFSPMIYFELVFV